MLTALSLFVASALLLVAAGPKHFVVNAASDEDCRLCIYLHAQQIAGIPLAFPFNFNTTSCAKFNATVNADVAKFLPKGAVTKPFQLDFCNGTYIKICGSIKSALSENDKVSQSFYNALERWYSFWSGYPVRGFGFCPARLAGYRVVLRLAGELLPELGDDPYDAPFIYNCGSVVVGTGNWCWMPNMNGYNEPTSYYYYSGPTNDAQLPWSCSGSMDQLSTRFAMKNTYVVRAGRNTTQYCFPIATVQPTSPNSTCGNSTTLSKVQFWLDASQRSKLVAVTAKPRTGALLKWTAPSFATNGTAGAFIDVLPVAPIGWNANQANGAEICLEVSKDTDMNSFCKSGYDGQCWASLLDTSENCCPMYGASITPPVKF